MFTSNTKPATPEKFNLKVSSIAFSICDITISLMNMATAKDTKKTNQFTSYTIPYKFLANTDT